MRSPNSMAVDHSWKTFHGSSTNSTGPTPLASENISSSELCVRSLLNCYYREVAAPNNQYQICSSEALVDGPEELKSHLEISSGKIIRIILPHSETVLLAAIHSYLSPLGNIDYQNIAYVKYRESQWIRLNGITLTELLNYELSGKYACKNEPDFLKNVRDSIRVMSLLLSEALVLQPLSFINSEQSLVSGHPFHPSPKSRLDFTDDEVRLYSPEFHARFQLHYFSVNRRYIVQESLLHERADQLVYLDRIPDQALGDDKVIVPVHPWQARHLLKLPELRSAIDAGEIRYLGQMGPEYFPTSSVRTVYCPQNSYFYKLSLHVRITNCIRRNALSELQSSLEITRIMQSLKSRYQGRYPSFCALEEPAYLTVDLRLDNPAARTFITEGFGMCFRSATELQNEKSSLVVLAAALFGNQDLGRGYLTQLISEYRSSLQAHEDSESGFRSDLAHLRKLWFQAYIENLLPPLLDLFFEDGLMFEAHLQNTLIGLKNGIPNQIFIRDFDNARVIAGTDSAESFRLSRPEVYSQSVFSEANAWNRFIYCLIVNHLGEAIYQLADHDFELEQKLWNILGYEIERYAETSRSEKSKSLLTKLLSNPTLPAKGNLLTRFQRTPDSQAGYVPIPNPLTRTKIFY